MDRLKKIQALLENPSIPKNISEQINIELEALVQELQYKKGIEADNSKEQQVRKLFDNIYGYIIELDAQGCIINCNKAAKRFLGIKEGEFFFPPSITHPNNPAKSDKYLNLLKSQGYYENYQGKMILSNGKPIHIEVSSVGKFNEEGELVGSIDTLRDITERVQITQELKASNAKYKTLVENSHFGILQTDIKGNIVYSSPRANEITGTLNNTQASINNFSKYILPEEMEDVMERLALLVTEKMAVDKFRQRIFKQDGEVIYIEGMTVLIKDVEGEPTGLNIVFNDVTDKVKIEQALKASEIKYKALVVNTHFGIVQTSLDGRITYSSPRANIIMGYKQGKYSKKANFAKYIAPEELPRMFKQLELLKAGEILVDNFRGKFRREDGISICIEGTTVLLKNELGEPYGLNIVFDDITEKARIEEALKNSEERYKILVEASPSGISLNSIAGKRLYASKRSAEIFGYDSPEEMLKKNTADDMHPDYLEKLKQDFKKVLELDGQVLTETYKGIRLDGKEFYYEANGRVIEENGEKQILIIYNDVSEKIKTEQALKDSEERYKILVEACPSGISLLNTKGKRLYASKRSAEIFGYDSPEDMLKISSFMGIHPSYSKQLKTDFETLLGLNGEILTRTYKGLRTDGSTFFLEANSRTIQENGEKQILIIYNDVTARIKAEQNLAEKNKELEKYIESNLQLENFAHLASHDLREPLINILAFSNLLQGENSNTMGESAKIYLSYIQQSSKRMEQLINDLLNYATIGKYSKTKKIDCNELLENILTDYTATIQEHKVEINLHELPTINGYESELRSLFQNIISNAIKYRKKGTPPQIKIEAVEQGCHWKFTMTDNGIGILPKYYNKIFLIYKRISNRRQKEKSTGIGLAHCKKVVDLHNGKIWVESEIDNGSIFHFTLHKQL